MPHIKVPAGNGFNYYVQAAQPERYSNVLGVETFEVQSKDYWNGPTGSDANALRERCEARSETEDAAGSTVSYSFNLMIPKDMPEIGTKLTLGQWHNGDYDNVFNHYINGVFSIALNNHPDFKLYPIPVVKGEWNNLSYVFTWGETDGAVRVYLNGNIVLDLTGLKLLTKGKKSIYFKYGIYRNVGKLVAPTQRAMYSNVKRSTTIEPVKVETPIPAPTIDTVEELAKLLAGMDNVAMKAYYKKRKLKGFYEDVRTLAKHIL